MSWRDEAACANPRELLAQLPDVVRERAEVFFPIGNTSTFDAKALCARCPVKAACLAEALSMGFDFGVWGGLDENERRALRKPSTSKSGRAA